jgi:hypothetical protein
MANSYFAPPVRRRAPAVKTALRSAFVDQATAGAAPMERCPGGESCAQAFGDASTFNAEFTIWCECCFIQH